MDGWVGGLVEGGMSDGGMDDGGSDGLVEGCMDMKRMLGLVSTVSISAVGSHCSYT